MVVDLTSLYQDAKEFSHSKKVLILQTFLHHFTKRNEIVLDIFGGIGSTLIAAESLERMCYLVEIEPRWCDIILRRWE